MSTPPTNRTAAQLSLIERLHVLRMANSISIHQAVARQLNRRPQTISEIVQSRRTLEKLKYSPTKRRNLDPNDKLKVIHPTHKLNKVAEVGRMCKTNPRTVLRCWKNRNALAELSSAKIPGTINRLLKLRFPAIELCLEQFIRYVRSQ